MSAIDLKLKKLKEQEEQLKLENKKIEFLRHIEECARNYEDKDFAEIKDAVVKLLSDFVGSAVLCIETGQTLFIDTVEQQQIKRTPAAVPTQTAEAAKTEPTKTSEPAKPKAVPELSPGEKMDFALDNRHLAGKKVKVANDKNIDINGEVVGLDAPFVLVKTDTGPTIKVPLPNVSLV